MEENLFSYGTLQDEAVQLATFRRKLFGTADTLGGYRTDMVEITDEAVIATSGQTYHPIVSYSGNSADTVSGTVFQITDAELLQADEYEVDDYQRVIVDLMSGTKAWVYIKR